MEYLGIGVSKSKIDVALISDSFEDGSALHCYQSISPSCGNIEGDRDDAVSKGAWADSIS